MRRFQCITESFVLPEISIERKIGPSSSHSVAKKWRYKLVICTEVSRKVEPSIHSCAWRAFAFWMTSYLTLIFLISKKKIEALQLLVTALITLCNIILTTLMQILWSNIFRNKTSHFYSCIWEGISCSSSSW